MWSSDSFYQNDHGNLVKMQTAWRCSNLEMLGLRSFESAMFKVETYMEYMKRVSEDEHAHINGQ